MNSLKGIAKGGWHPKHDVDLKKPSARGDFKGISQMANFVGKGKSEAPEPRDHSAAPLSTLKDPSAFGPPPQHIAKGAASSDDPQPASPAQRRAAPPTPPARNATNSRQVQPQTDKSTYRPVKPSQQTRSVPSPPPVPSRSTTPSAAPPPPSHPHILPNRQALPQRSESSSKPAPRLPPRQNSNPSEHAPEPPPSYVDATGQRHDSDHDRQQQRPLADRTNSTQSSLNRLGQAGISVPSFNIGHTASPADGHSSSTAQTSSPASTKQLSELQSRFAQMTNKPAPGTPDQSTRAFPSVPSLSNRPTLGTSSEAEQVLESGASQASKKGRPPPPPPKKKNLSAPHPDQTDQTDPQAPEYGEPPPIPLASKPR